MRATELRGGLWHWTAPHPDWTPDDGGPEGWEQEVSCYYAQTVDTVLLIDPLIPADDRDEFLHELDRDADRNDARVRVVLTAPWHRRSADELAQRYSSIVWSPDGGLGPPAGVKTFSAEALPEVLLWIEWHKALVSGDILLGDGRGGVRLAPESWLAESGFDHARLREALRPLLDLPVEYLLPTHGEPVVDGARDALARALGQ
jgi:hypothetical protein